MKGEILMKVSRQVLFCLLAFGLITSVANAGVTCEVSTSGVAFGSYDSIGNQERDTSATIAVTCSGTTGDAVSYTISLGTGAGSYSNRNMSAGGTVLTYNLYTDISRTQVWGDGNGTAVVADSYTLSASPTTRYYTVYGRIPQGQTQATAGSYSDSLVVTVVY